MKGMEKKYNNITDTLRHFSLNLKSRVAIFISMKFAILSFLFLFILSLSFCFGFLLREPTTEDFLNLNDSNTNTVHNQKDAGEGLREEYAILEHELLEDIPTDFTLEILKKMTISTGETKIIEFDVPLSKENKKYWRTSLMGLDGKHTGGEFTITIHGPDDRVLSRGSTNGDILVQNFQMRKSGKGRIEIKAVKVPSENYPIVFAGSSKEVEDSIDIQVDFVHNTENFLTPLLLSEINKKTDVLSMILYSNPSIYFDVEDIDLTSLEFNGAPFYRKSIGTQASDGQVEVEFLISKIKAGENDDFYLKGQTFDGVPIIWSSIRG